jgi:hypothetical protein
MGSDPQGQAGQPSEEDRSEVGLRAAYEAELSRITSADMILQAAVSLLNLGGRRLGLVPGSEGERDLEQVRDAIDGVRALLGILERNAPEELRPLRDALSQLQIAYAREAQAAGGADPAAGHESPAGRKNAAGAGGKPGAPVAPGKPDAPAAGANPDAPATGGKPGVPPPAEEKPGAGPAESSGRLWVPGR